MLFLGLGTGLGSAMIVDGHLEPMELAHLPTRRARPTRTTSGCVASTKLGKEWWRKAVAAVASSRARSSRIGGARWRQREGSSTRAPRGTRLGKNDQRLSAGLPSLERREASRARRQLVVGEGGGAADGF